MIRTQRFIRLAHRSVLSDNSRRSLASGTRGARGHGWYVNYRAGKGGRHLQGEYHDRESPNECAAWNDAILAMGSERVYMDIVMEPRRTVQLNPKKIELPPLDSLTGDKFRIEMDVATKVMPETAQNFIDLLSAEVHGYLGTRLYRVEKGVGLKGGDVLANSGRLGKAANGNPMALEIHSDPLAMWHLPGTVSMIVPKVKEIDSRFLLVSQPAPHIDGIGRAFGRMTPESLEVVVKWETTLLTKTGVPTSFDLIVTECGVGGQVVASLDNSEDIPQPA